MPDERVKVTLGELARWLLVAAVVLLGIGLWFAVGRRSEPVVQAPALEPHR